MGRHSLILMKGTPVNPSREPATLLLGLLAPAVAALSAFLFAASPETQTLVNVAAVAVAGAVTAFLVKSDNLLPAITGAIAALVALIVGLGAGWDAGQQATLLVALGAVAAYLVRDRVTARVPAAQISG